ncbi:MAG: helix-turn-helix domain-containing protein [Chloroflexota bacterium]
MSEIQLYDLSFSEAEIPFSVGRIPKGTSGPLSNTPRRHNYFLLLWVESGDGANLIDFESYPLEPYQLHLVRPGQVQYWDNLTALKGYFLVFKEELFQLKGSTSLLEKLTLFDSVDGQPVFTFSTDEAELMSEHFEKLVSELKQKELAWIEAIVSLLQLILIAAERRQKQLYATPILNAGQALTQEFHQLVKSSAIEHHNLSYYADRLGISPAYLSALTKDVVGLSAGKILRQQLALEAKRLLAHSTLTVAQIADQLNFEDASYFGRFFKRETQQTPRQFRTAFLKK